MRGKPVLAALFACSLPLASAQGDFELAVTEGLLTLRAENASLRAIAERLAAASGIEVVLEGEGDSRVSADIEDESIERALHKIAPGHLLVHGEGGKALRGIVLYAAGSGGGEANLPDGNVIEDTSVYEEPVYEEPEYREPMYDANGVPLTPGAAPMPLSPTTDPNDLGPEPEFAPEFAPDGTPIGADGLPLAPPPAHHQLEPSGYNDRVDPVRIGEGLQDAPVYDPVSGQIVSQLAVPAWLRR